MNTLAKNKVIGYTCGVFDLFHVGHLNLLEKCKLDCDYLIVGLCNDEYVISKKNKNPIYPENDRYRILSALKCVDEVHIVDSELVENKMLAWNKFHFDILFSGSDWKGSERYVQTEKDFSKINVKIKYYPYTNGISTTSIRSKLNDNEY